MVYSYNHYQCVVDFGNGKSIENIFVQFIGRTGKTRICYRVSLNEYHSKTTDDQIQIGEWAHIAVTYKNQEFNYYVDGSLKFTFKPNVPIPDLNKERTSNFIGSSNWNYKIDGVLDELKIFDRALTNDEINNEKEIKQPYNIITL